MATLIDFKLQVKGETGKSVRDPEVVEEAKKRLKEFEARQATKEKSSKK